MPATGGYHAPTPTQSPCVTPRGQAQLQNAGFGIDDLQVGMAGGDPSQEPLRSQILAKLGLPQQARIERLSNNSGGLNAGVWVVEGSLVLKLVQSQCAHRVSEAERFAKLSREQPSIANDPTLAFPVKVFRCIGHGGAHSHDLIVMRKVRGQPLGDVIALKRGSGQLQDVMRILRQLGSFLSRFHRSYHNKQHGDFQPSNVFYDETSGAFTMIDIADLGSTLHSEGDVSHFCKSLQLLSHSYGQQFYIEGKRNFEEGYRS
jgi:serine/threonine protein kinase